MSDPLFDMFYTLDDDGNPRECSMEEWYSCAKTRVVAKDVVNGLLVSTVFLGVEHIGGIFETMVFHDWGGEEQERYWTKADALAGHARFVERARDWSCVREGHAE